MSGPTNSSQVMPRSNSVASPISTASLSARIWRVFHRRTAALFF